MSADNGSRRKLFLLLTFLMTTLSLIINCSIESPKAPDWDTDVTFPLIARHYDIYELIDRMAEDALTYDSLGNLSLSFEQYLDTVSIDAGLSTEQISENFNHRLGSVTIASPQSQSLELDLNDYVSLATGDVPDVGFSANMAFNQIQEFESAIFSEGILIISITNYFDLEIDSLMIWIIDNITADTVAEYVIDGGLNVGENRIDTIGLEGISVSNSLSFNSWIHTPGGTLLSTTNKYLAVEMQIPEGAKVSSAVAQIPAQEKNYTGFVTLLEDHRISAASISSGQINLHVENYTELQSDVVMEIPEVTLSGSPLIIQTTLPAGGQFDFNQNLDGYELAPDLSGSSMAVNIELTAYILGSGDNLVAVNSNDQIAIQAGVSDLQFSQVTGIIAPTEIEIEPVYENIDLPRGFEDVTLTDAVLVLNVYSQANIPTEVDIDIAGGAGQYLNVASQLTPGTPQNPGITRIEITDLESLTNPIPSEITISGIAVAGDGISTGTVYSDSKVWGDLEISSPLKFAIGEIEIEGDINSTDIDQDDIDEFTDRLNSGTIYATITNHLPFGCEVELYLNGDTATLFTSPQLTIGPLTVNAGQVDAGGLVEAETVSQIEVHLSETDLDIIENPTLYIGQRIYLPGTGGQVVNVVNTDYLDINAYIRLNARVGGEWN